MYKMSSADPNSENGMAGTDEKDGRARMPMARMDMGVWTAVPYMDMWVHTFRVGIGMWA